MAFNLLETVQGYLTDELVNQAGSFLGESNEGVTKALSGIVPLVIGKFTEEASTESGAQQLLDIAKSDEATGILGNLGNFFGDDNKDLMSKGGELVSGLFGDQANGMVEQIASFAGIKGDSVSSLLSMAAPTVLGAIGKGANDNNIDAAGLVNMIDSQSSGLLGFIPESLQGLIGALGLGKLGSLLTGAVGSVGSGVSAATGAVADGAGKVVDGASDLAGGAVDAGKAAVEKTGEVVGDAAGAVADGAGKVVDGASDLAGGAVDAGKAAVEKTGEVVGDAAGAVADGAGKVVDGASDLAGGAVDAGKAAVEKTGEVVGDAAGAVAVGAGKVVDGASNLAGNVVDAGKAAVEKTGEVIGDAAGAVAAGAGKVVDGASELAGDAVDAGKAAVEKTGEVVGDAAGAVADGAGKVVDGASELAGDAVDAGKAAVEKTGEVIGDAAEAVADGAEVAVKKTTSFIKWLLPLVLLLGIVFLLWKCLSEPAKDAVNTISDGVENVADGAVDAGKAAVNATGDVVEGAANAVVDGAETVAKGVAGTLDAAGNFIYDLGNETEINLPEGVTLKVGDNSTEAKLLAELKNRKPVSPDNTKGWITCDRLYFQHGSSNLTVASDEQLNNLAAILKAFPAAKIKIGGYTDNTGSLEANKAISQKRADMAKEKLVGLGVNADQISAEGYGPEHPVCAANDTDECKAQNRRIDLRVTAK
ncbi:phosphoglucomutase (alpha-D-glucose-1,6-bisphosphate-dependent) [Flavobacteriaceae bacterium UJ101]|nr:phosphoglucomutase (alpha-D-glucose-1,6-bisphosphate-dependent) [Flavobacteriaceae bacterium UJ101]